VRFYTALSRQRKGTASPGRLGGGQSRQSLSVLGVVLPIPALGILSLERRNQTPLQNSWQIAPSRTAGRRQ
jgi:hypothetical protein